MAREKKQPVSLFPEAPEDLSGLSVDELNALATEFQTVARKIAANDADTLAGIAPEDGGIVIEQMTAGVAELERIREELSGREAEEAEWTEKIGSLAEKFGIADDDPQPAADEPSDELADDAKADDEEADDDGEGDEPAAEASADTAEPELAPEPTAAAEPEKPKVRRPVPAAPASHQPRATEPAEPKAAPLVAAGGLETVVRPGQKLNRAELVDALIEADRLTQQNKGKSKVIVASASYTFPPERMLTTRDPDGNLDKIRAITDVDHPRHEAVLASGGFCAPFPPLYDLPILASAVRPVRDYLPGFGAERGGITYPTPLGLSDVTDGISVITAAQDEAGGSAGTKACVIIDCDEFQSAEVQAIAACVQHGNLNARAWPERVANVTDLLAAAHAQAAETELLAGLTAGSTAVTDERKYGAFSTIVQGTLKAAAAYRSRHRMDPDAVLSTLWPAWMADLVAADLAHNGYTRLDANVVRGAIEGYLRRSNVDVGWYIDQDGTTTQVYGAQGAAALLEFLTEVKWYLFSRGTWIFLDFGRLDFGVTRDSDLNSTNDFNVMYETFEGVANVGIESLAIVSTVCPDGSTAGAVASPSTIDDFFACAA